MEKIFYNKKGRMVIRDVVLLTIILSSVLVLASTFVTEMAGNYGNTNMTNEYSLSNVSISGSNVFSSITGDVDDASNKLRAANETKGLWGIVSGVSEATVTIIKVFINAPTTVANLLISILLDSDVNPTFANTLRLVVSAVLWMILIAAVLTAFRAGSEV